jgi:molecular chaperone DnaK
MVQGAGAAAPFTRAVSDPHGAKALAMDFKAQHGIDVTKDEQAMQRLGAAWSKAATELQSAPSTEVNLPFLTATNNGPVHYQRTLDLKTFKILLAQARKP